MSSGPPGSTTPGLHAAPDNGPALPDILGNGSAIAIGATSRACYAGLHDRLPSARNVCATSSTCELPIDCFCKHLHAVKEIRILARLSVAPIILVAKPNAVTNPHIDNDAIGMRRMIVPPTNKKWRRVII